MTAPYVELQQLSQTSGFVELYTLDCTALGGSVYRFTNEPNPDGGPLVFGGSSYTPLPIKSEGWDFSSTGTPPKPTLTVSNVSRLLLADVIGLGDLVGATVSRVRTYAKFLDAATFTRRNLLNYSQQAEVTTSGWAKTNTAATGNTGPAPDGTMTADRIREVAVTPASPYFYITQTATTGLSGNTYTFSTYVKAQERSFANIRFDDGAGVNTATVTVNLTTGALSSPAVAGAVSNVSAQVIECADGWFRVALTATWASITSVRCFVRPALDGANYTTSLGYPGDITKGFLVWGMQLENGSFLTDYQATALTHHISGDPSKFIGPEVYVVEQKTGHNSEFIQWQLTSILDRFGMKLPRRQVLKDKGFPGVSRTRVTG